MTPKIIRTEEMYQDALLRVEDLMNRTPSPGSEEFEEMDLLSLLIERYEEEAYPMDLPDARSAILFRMEQEGLTRNDMLQYLGSPSKVSEVLSGKRSLSLSMMRKLAGGLGIPAEVLLKEEKPHTAAVE